MQISREWAESGHLWKQQGWQNIKLITSVTYQCQTNNLITFKCSKQKLLLPSGLEPVPIEFRVRRVIIEQRRAAYWWFPFVAPYLCRPRSTFHSAFTIPTLKYYYVVLYNSMSSIILSLGKTFYFICLTMKSFWIDTLPYILQFELM